jgi:Asp-tRNA(Asn)/Glu-tRNA(Gln) amidotransferase A subunit family amidase
VWEEEALERAREVDARVGAGERLPLAGVPIGVKGRHGLRTAGPLLAAGCVPVGATSVPGPGTPWQTWGLGRHGRTVNPWRYDRTPGGSSAGSAAAVAAGLVPLATGSDGAGSVRIPAAWCGVVGLKVSNGRLPSADRTGLMAPGVLARCVGDVAAYWGVMSGAYLGAAPGPHPGAGPGLHPGSAPAAHREAVPKEYREAVPGHGPRTDAVPGVHGGPRARTSTAATAGEYATPTAVWSPDLGFDAPDPDVVAVARSAAVAGTDYLHLRLDEADHVVDAVARFHMTAR